MRDLHDQLRSLVSQHGAGIAENAEQFRAALDDYLTEDDATQGELNLLVDAVRLGGVDRLLTMLENRADPEAAVREAGGELARDRSSDEQRARWAVAAMGYALGRIDAGVVRQQLEGDVTRLPYGATTPAAQRPPVQSPPVQSPPYQSPVQSPPFQSPVQSPPFQSPPFQSPPQQSPGPDTAGPPAWPSRPSSGQPPVHSGPGYPSQPSPMPAYASTHTQPRKSHTGLVVGLVTVGIVAIAGAIILALVLGGDDPKETADDSSGETSEGPKPCEGERCLKGEGYSYELPEGWRDISETVREENPAQGTLDTASAWGGDTIAEGRANVIVEVAGWTYTDLDDARDVLKTNLADLGGSIENIDSRTIDGEDAAGVVLTRTNESGVEVEQTAYIMRNGEDAVVITASNKSNDNGPKDAYQEIYDSWVWE
jgi:hypothetical protein